MSYQKFLIDNPAKSIEIVTEEAMELRSRLQDVYTEAKNIQIELTHPNELHIYGVDAPYSALKSQLDHCKFKTDYFKELYRAWRPYSNHLHLMDLDGDKIVIRENAVQEFIHLKRLEALTKGMSNIFRSYTKKEAMQAVDNFYELQTLKTKQI